MVARTRLWAGRVVQTPIRPRRAEMAVRTPEPGREPARKSAQRPSPPPAGRTLASQMDSAWHPERSSDQRHRLSARGARKLTCSPMLTVAQRPRTRPAGPADQRPGHQRGWASVPAPMPDRMRSLWPRLAPQRDCSTPRLAPQKHFLSTRPVRQRDCSSVSLSQTHSPCFRMPRSAVADFARTHSGRPLFVCLPCKCPVGWGVCSRRRR